jgi:anthranilate synthase/aminodeoxychorismate synthase-like glutamine amidotransferase
VILLLDNYDSFVHNLARYFRRLGCQTKVLRSDQVDVETCLKLNPQAVVFSPGPKGPTDTGCCIDLVHRLPREVPVLGVCLGHQAIAVAFGGSVSRCGPMHGMSSRVIHRQDGLFSGLPSPMTVGRYHSLAVEADGLPSCLKITGQTDDGMIMSLRHVNRPVFGVQFHPESVLTEHGLLLLKNFQSFIASSDPATSDYRGACL